MNVQVRFPYAHDYRPDIDGLRAIAVVMVIAFHAFPSYFRHGYIGVDVFFVISGYLITGILLRNHSEGLAYLWSFYGRRIRRIFPALIVFLVTAGVAGYLVLLPAEFKALDYYLLPSLDFGNKGFNLAERNGIEFETYRFETLEYLYGMAERTRVRRAA